jgi:hypothetical protein
MAEPIPNIEKNGLHYTPVMAATICIQHVLVNADWDAIIDQCFPEIGAMERIGVINSIERKFQRINNYHLHIKSREQNHKRYTTPEQNASIQRRAKKTIQEKKIKLRTELKQKYLEELKLEENIRIKEYQSRNSRKQYQKTKIKKDPFVQDPNFAVDPKEEREEMP